MRFVVFDLGGGLGHEPLENSVDGFEEGRAATEIFAEMDDLAGAFVGGGGKAAVAIEKSRGFGEAEAEDALLDIADTEKIGAMIADALVAQEAEDGILNGIDVLIFIDKDVAELLVEGAGERRWPRRHGIAVAKDGEGHALKIGEVEGALGGFGFGIFGGEIVDEGEEGARERSDAAEAILPLGGGEVQEIAEGFFPDGVFHGID